MLQIFRQCLKARVRVAHARSPAFVRNLHCVEYGELGRVFLIGVIGVPGGVGADFRGIALTVFMAVGKHADQWMTVDEDAWRLSTLPPGHQASQ